jgi:hypothetical protein
MASLELVVFVVPHSEVPRSRRDAPTTAAAAVKG